MLFIISEQIAHRALDEHIEKSLLVMNSLEACLKYGKHMVFAHHGVLEYIQQKAPKDYPFIISILSSYSTIGSAARQMSWHAEFIVDQPSYRDEEHHVIYINEAELPRFELVKETHLLGEHLKDVQYIAHIMRYYQKEHELKPMSRYYSLLGGGSSIAHVYENEIKEGHAFVLCITDGDKKYPTDEIGDTGKNVQKMDEAYHKPFHAYYYNMQDVTEMENLIPWSVIEKYATESKDPEVIKRLQIIKRIKDANEAYLSYFDYKEGISKTKETEPNLLEYQMDIMKVIDPMVATRMKKDEEQWQIQKQQFIESGLANDAKEAEKIIKYIRKKIKYISGICENILESVIINYSYELSNIKKTDLSTDQLQEYERIGELAYSWTCCLDPVIP